MGKSAAAALLQQHGVPVIDTDQLARQVVSPGQPALAQIVHLFGSDMLSGSGELRRDALARRVFPDPVARRQLEELLHPLIRSLWRDQVAELEHLGHSKAVVVIPLLFETGAERELSSTICIACSLATQAQRLSLRGWTEDQVRQRLAAQFTIEKKMASAHFVVWNEAGLDVLWAQLARVIDAA